MGVPLVGDVRLQPPDVLGNMQRAVALRSLQQASAAQQQMLPAQLAGLQAETQERQTQAQLGQMQLGQAQAMNTAYHDALETDDQGQVHINNDKLMRSLAGANHGAAIPGIMQNLNAYQKSMADLQESQAKVQEQSRDSMGFLGSAIQKANYDPAVADLLIEQRMRSPGVPASEAAQLNQMRQQITANPGLIRTFADQAVQQSAKQQQMATTLTAAQLRAGEGPLTPEQIQSYNRMLPQEMQLPPGATKDDIKNLTQMMEFRARQADAQGQRDIANSFRQASLNLAQQGLQLRQQTAAESQQSRQEAAVQRSYQFTQTQLENVAKPVDALAGRMSRLIDTMNQRSPQADALVAPELLSVMAGGAGSGVRMNEAEIARIVGGRSAWQNLQAAVQHWSTDPSAARSITPSQDTQIRSLIQVVQSKMVAKQAAIDDARSRLTGSNDPQEHREILEGARRRMTEIDAGGPAATPPGGKGPPPGATHIATGPDGQRHYIDAQQRDLGLVGQ